jgi:hypothetical protein
LLTCTVSGSLGTSGPAGATDTSAPLEQQETVVPIGPWGREAGANLRLAFRSAAEGSVFGFASRKMSLWSPDRILKTAATDFKEASKGPSGSRARAYAVRDRHDRSGMQRGKGPEPAALRPTRP